MDSNVRQNNERNQQRGITVASYNRLISDLQRLFLGIQAYKKRRAEAFMFSVLQSQFLLFCSVLFLILHWRINFVQEIAFLPLFIISVKDIAQSIKAMRQSRKLAIEFHNLIDENYLDMIPNILENLMILLQFVLITICFNKQENQYYKLMPIPYSLSLFCRWVLPIILKCLCHRKTQKDREIEAALQQSGGSSANFRPYYIFLAMSFIFSCGSLFLFFNYLCQRVNQNSYGRNPNQSRSMSQTFNSRYTVDEESDHTNNTQSVFNQNLSQIMLNNRDRNRAGNNHGRSRARERGRDRDLEQRSQSSVAQQQQSAPSSNIPQNEIQRGQQDQRFSYKIHEKIEMCQREIENSQNEGDDGRLNGINAEKLNTLQENLTRVNIDTVEDLPFSKFLVRISQSYYQTIGKFAKSLFSKTAVNQRRMIQPQKSRYKSKMHINKKIIQKQQQLSFKKSQKVKMNEQFKFDIKDSKVNETDIIDILSIPDENMSQKRTQKPRKSLNNHQQNFSEQDASIDKEDNLFQSQLAKLGNDTLEHHKQLSEILIDDRQCFTTNLKFDDTENIRNLDIEFGFEEHEINQHEQTFKTPFKGKDILKDDDQELNIDDEKKQNKNVASKNIRKPNLKLKKCYSADSVYNVFDDDGFESDKKHEKSGEQKDGNSKRSKNIDDETPGQIKISSQQQTQYECMLCLSEPSNCVLMDCGHSNICFNCAMRLAIKSRRQGQMPLCHLCREEIQYALKIQVSEEIMVRIKQGRDTESPTLNPDLDDEKPQKNYQNKQKKGEQYVKILSYVDMREGIPRQLRQNNRRRQQQKLPKFKEHIISQSTKWQVENADHSAMMNEFGLFENIKDSQMMSQSRKNSIKKSDLNNLQSNQNLDMQNQSTKQRTLDIQLTLNPDNTSHTNKCYFDKLVSRYNFPPQSNSKQLDWGRRRNSN
ncbi:zinc finger domain protein [Stylonychia lemnae]|uniref:Zinc finger domain protein n=1 Tax=Stylonychia lemnae TaxID=5949 RepID=A0A078AKN9_STYLE|nr:zinc finger domain protein [Stylonychia lemnae]|eukprot:CDW82012.1 zinc finger domain protein [Stylonychia lemnae]